MKISYIKKLKPCFGNKKMFYKEKVDECKGCQFKRRCLLKVKGIGGGGEEYERKN